MRLPPRIPARITTPTTITYFRSYYQLLSILLPATFGVTTSYFRTYYQLLSELLSRGHRVNDTSTPRTISQHSECTAFTQLLVLLPLSLSQKETEGKAKHRLLFRNKGKTQTTFQKQRQNTDYFSETKAKHRLLFHRRKQRQNTDYFSEGNKGKTQTIFPSNPTKPYYFPPTPQLNPTAFPLHPN